MKDIKPSTTASVLLKVIQVQLVVVPEYANQGCEEDSVEDLGFFGTTNVEQVQFAKDLLGDPICVDVLRRRRRGLRKRLLNTASPRKLFFTVSSRRRYT